MTPVMLDWLLDEKRFKEHVALTLAERAVMLHRQFPEVRVSPQLIGKYFRKFGVKLKQVVLKKKIKWGNRMRV